METENDNDSSVRKNPTLKAWKDNGYLDKFISNPNQENQMLLICEMHDRAKAKDIKVQDLALILAGQGLGERTNFAKKLVAQGYMEATTISSSASTAGIGL